MVIARPTPLTKDRNTLIWRPFLLWKKTSIEAPRLWMFLPHKTVAINWVLRLPSPSRIFPQPLRLSVLLSTSLPLSLLQPCSLRQYSVGLPSNPDSNHKLENVNYLSVISREDREAGVGRRRCGSRLCSTSPGSPLLVHLTYWPKLPRSPRRPSQCLWNAPALHVAWCTWCWCQNGNSARHLHINSPLGVEAITRKTFTQ